MSSHGSRQNPEIGKVERGGLRKYLVSPILFITVVITLLLSTLVYFKTSSRPQSSGVTLSWPEDQRLHGGNTITIGFKVGDEEVKLDPDDIEQEVFRHCESELKSTGKFDNIRISLPNASTYQEYPLNVGINFYLSKSRANSLLSEITYTITRTKLAEIAYKVHSGSLASTMLDDITLGSDNGILRPIDGNHLPIVEKPVEFSVTDSNASVKTLILARVKYYCAWLGKEIHPGAHESLAYESKLKSDLSGIHGGK